jgi:hypothetical protein
VLVGSSGFTYKSLLRLDIAKDPTYASDAVLVRGALRSRPAAGTGTAVTPATARTASGNGSRHRPFGPPEEEAWIIPSAGFVEGRVEVG